MSIPCYVAIIQKNNRKFSNIQITSKKCITLLIGIVTVTWCYGVLGRWITKLDDEWTRRENCHNYFITELNEFYLVRSYSRSMVVKAQQNQLKADQQKQQALQGLFDRTICQPWTRRWSSRSVHEGRCGRYRGCLGIAQVWNLCWKGFGEIITFVPNNEGNHNTHLEPSR